MRTIDIKRLPRRKINTAITAVSPELGPVEDQLVCISNWSETIPHILVAGATEPFNNNGVRWMRTTITNPPVKNVLSSYLTPGNEVCILAAPNIKIGGDQEGLMDFVSQQQMELSWMAYAYAGASNPVVIPDLFVLSKSVVAHIATTIPNNLSFANSEWIKWINDWGKKYMPKHRYFDVTAYGIALPGREAPLNPLPELIEAESPVLNAYDLPEEEMPLKPKETPKKGKKGWWSKEWENKP